MTAPWSLGDVTSSTGAIEELYRQGRVKAIGVSNFHPERVMDFIVHNEVVPAVNQVETHPFHQQVATRAFLQENGIQIELSGPFAEGRNHIFQNELLRSIAEKHQESVAQVIVCWLTQRGVVAIPKSTHRQRIAENFSVFDFELTPEEMAAIATLDTEESLLRPPRPGHGQSALHCQA